MSAKKAYVCAMVLLMSFGSITAKIPGTNVPTVGDPISTKNKILFPRMGNGSPTFGQRLATVAGGIIASAALYVIQEKVNEIASQGRKDLEKKFSKKDNTKPSNEDSSKDEEKNEKSDVQ